MLGVIIFIYVIGFIIGGVYGLLQEEDAGLALTYAFLWIFWLIRAIAISTVKKLKSG